jgi:chaperonin GroES
VSLLKNLDGKLQEGTLTVVVSILMQVMSIGKEATSIEKGQKVLFSDINAYEVNLGTPEKLCFCCISDLLAIVE